MLEEEDLYNRILVLSEMMQSLILIPVSSYINYVAMCKTQELNRMFDFILLSILKYSVDIHTCSMLVSLDKAKKGRP